jgi:hypothetical protein
VLKHRLVPALLLVVPATAALSASTAFVQAAEECRVKPSPAAPKGSRWLYRINRAEHRRCWFLSSRDVGLHSQVSRRHRHLGGDTDAVRQDEQRGSDLRVASAPTDESDVVAVAKPPAVSQNATPSVQQVSENLVPRSVPIIAYRLPPRSSQTVAGPTGAEQRAMLASAGASTSNGVFLVGAAAAGLLFAGGAFHLTRHVKRRSHNYTVPDRGEVRGTVAIRASVPQKLPPMMTTLGNHHGLRELKRDLKRASEAGNLSRSDRKRAASGAISLPHASTWLRRPKTEPSAKLANCCGAGA